MTGDIVIADDDAIMRQLLQYKLQTAGYAVTAFENGMDCWEHASENPPPDLFVLDVMMPGLDGVRLLRRIKSTDRLASTPVVMLTSRGNEDDVIEGLESGAAEYVTKPFSPNELLTRIQRVLD